MRISPTIVLRLEKDGQRITIDVEEAKELIRDLGSFVKENNTDQSDLKNHLLASGQRKYRIERNRRIAQYQLQLQERPLQSTGSHIEKVPRIYMSEAKIKAITHHINRELSSRPRTLSSLLKGVSYMPNHLSVIRNIVESQSSVGKRKIGKRTYYFRK